MMMSVVPVTSFDAAQPYGMADTFRQHSQMTP
jgi:hypothetical protein